MDNGTREGQLSAGIYLTDGRRLVCVLTSQGGDGVMVEDCMNGNLLILPWATVDAGWMIVRREADTDGA
jgi:hypothetical protein